jgi:outer membrane protein OmpA-like peptidoglycan-associated protein
MTNLALLLAVLSVPSVQAQVIPTARIGLTAGINGTFLGPSVQTWRSFASDTLPNLSPYVAPGIRFEDAGFGLGVMFGLQGAFPLSGTVHLGGRVAYNSFNGSSVVRQIRSDGTLESTIDVFASYVDISPQVELYGLFGDSPLYTFAGLDLSVPLAATTTQSAVLTSANSTVTQKLEDQRDIPEFSTRAALLVGLGYTLTYGTTIVQPFVSYGLPLTNLSAAPAFSPTTFGQLRLGVNLSIGFSKAKPLVSNKPILAGTMEKITGFRGTDQEVQVSSIDVEDVRYNEMFPLVPYVFCPEGGLPGDVDQSTTFGSVSGEFQVGSLPLDAVEVNRNLLNIIASRMKLLPQATLTITGTADGRSEKSAKGLPQSRADWTKSYLVGTCGIEGSRIVSRTTPIPDKPSSPNDPDGIAENRRIELSSNVPDVLAPVVIAADNQRVANFDVVMFYPRLDGDTVRSWSMTISQAGRPLRELNGTFLPQKISWSIRPNELSAAQVPVDYEMVMRNVDADSVVVSGSIPVEYVSSVQKKTENLADKTVDKYSLVLFDFDEADLTQDNVRTLETMVLPNIRSNSKVNIIGYTDRIGNDAYNEKLSRERAEAVRAFLTARAKEATYSVNGVGEATEVFSNATPIGRQLSRTVQVIVETPRR